MTRPLMVTGGRKARRRRRLEGAVLASIIAACVLALVAYVVATALVLYFLGWRP